MKIGIIGCGVVGLTTGIALLESGLEVEIIAREVSPNLVSDVAAAFWFPYKIVPRERVITWSADSYEVFTALSRDQSSGVVEIPSMHFYEGEAPDPWWTGCARDFRKLGPEELYAPYTSGYAYTSFMIQSPIYMPYLRARFETLGGVIRMAEVRSLLELAPRFQVVVNCSGVGAARLTDDNECYPIRGQILRVKRPEGMPMGVWETANVFVACRSSDCIIGGVNEEHDWDLTPRADDRTKLLERCRVFKPELLSAEVIGDVVGLRPGRTVVRLEAEKLAADYTVIHNYGHAGGGYTTSWGCAAEVLRHVSEIQST